MSRRLPPLPLDIASAAVVGALGLTVAGAMLFPVQGDAKPAAPKPDPYEHCIAAANHPVSGFATEVCEPLTPEWREPDYSDYVYTGPMSWEYQGATVSVPGLAEGIADGCADTPDLLDCVGAVIGQRMEHRP